MLLMQLLDCWAYCFETWSIWSTSFIHNFNTTLQISLNLLIMKLAFDNAVSRVSDHVQKQFYLLLDGIASEIHPWQDIKSSTV